MRSHFVPFRSLHRCFYILAFLVLNAAAVLALDGAIYIHDPSTIVKCDGRYYVFGTGRGIPILTSTNGFTWQRGGRVFDRIPDSVKAYVPNNNGVDVWAPDIIKLNGTYYLYYAVSRWGQITSAIGLVTSPTLDPGKPGYKWTDRGMVVHSVDGEKLNTIDPGVIRAPDGTLWISYGSYLGNIQLAQLNPKTGLRIAPDSRVYIIANRSEASDIIYHEGYYYLFVNHGSCCSGINSTYNIRVGRSKRITGPYLDRHGDDLARGAGTLFAAAGGRRVGPGHFGLLVENGVEKFSCHYETDLDHAGRPILAIQPLLWTLDGWPTAGENLKDGVYQIRSQQTGTIVEIPAGAPKVGGPARLGSYLIRDNQNWTITRAGGGFYKITNLAEGAALQVAAGQPGPATVGGDVDTAAYTGADNQLWIIDELSDGSYRVESKVDLRALTVVMNASPGNRIDLQAWNGADTQRWALAAP